MGGTIYKDKNCLDCGVFMPHVPGTRKRCPECAKIQNRVSKRSYREPKTPKVRKEPAVNKEPTRNNDLGKHCKGCIYWGGGHAITQCCNYIFYTGKIRPCPPGKDCTVKATRRGKR